MRFPDAVNVLAIDDRQNVVANVAVVLVLFAAKKNDYLIGPFISDGGGRVRITRQDCENAIKQAHEMFVMDYTGSLEDCAPKAELRLHQPEHIQTMVRQYKNAPEFWGETGFWVIGENKNALLTTCQLY